MNQNFVNVFENLVKKHPKSANNIYYGLELFVNSLDYGIDAFNEEINEIAKKRDYSSLAEIAGYCNTIKLIQDTANSYLNEFAQRQNIDDGEDLIEEEDEKALPDYREYIVNDEIPHTLLENFTHKKICGFMLDGVRYNVSSWQDTLISLCELLAKRNKDLLYSFVDSPAFKGRKNSYFTKKNNGNAYFHKLKNVEIYVWTNLSTVMICEIIKKLLRGYSISINSMYIYLRADYSPLHIKLPESDVLREINSDEEKIVKHVRESFRKLSQDNYIFSNEMLSALTEKDKSKKYVGSYNTVFKEISDNTNISSAVKDEKGNPRYWQEVFTFNGIKYLITSQWYEQNRCDFDKWYNSLKG